MKDAYKILVGKHEGKRPLERPMYRWKDNIKIFGRVWTWFLYLRILSKGGLL
jgi:hypothetical protein